MRHRSRNSYADLALAQKAGTYVDFTAIRADGTAVRAQTIDTLADGVTPTLREADAAARIRAAKSFDELRLVPKVPQ